MSTFRFTNNITLLLEKQNFRTLASICLYIVIHFLLPAMNAIFSISIFSSYVRCSFKMRRLSQDTILSKKPKRICRVKKVCSEFESNLCNMITTSSKEVIFMKIHFVLIYLNRIIVEDPE